MIEIVEGLFEGQVLQRASRGVSDARFCGQCAVNGPLWARVDRKGRALRGQGWRRIGRVTKGLLRGRLAGVPTGGPYAIRLCVGPSVQASKVSHVLREVWVGDVWILAGQSNMQGGGARDAALPGISPVRAFFMDDRWALARDPLHNLWNAVAPVHGGKPDGEDPGVKGVGPGVSFGQAMYAYTGMPQGLLVCAQGGASMVQWDPRHKDLGGYSLYGATARRVRVNGGRVAGVVWYQGESDSMPHGAAEYLPRMQDLVRAFRRDCRDKRLPFVLVQLSRYAGENLTPDSWNAVQEHQRRLPSIISRVSTVPAIDLTLDDLVHVSGRSQQVLGVRLAEAMYALVHSKGALQPPIALKRVRVDLLKGEQTATITVEFDHVVGKLEAAGRPMGFTLRQGDAPVRGIFDIRLAGTTVQLKTLRTALDFPDKVLHYGYGMDPACNITDSAGRPLPVFGPARIMGPRPVLPFP
ncbi:MAG: sialate O-acetylesterase [Verrucomicrobia bacterium]|nr:sialate O-acetylesterase [Verrucomicrobiota bacterium]